MRFLIKMIGPVWKVLSPKSRRWLTRRFQTSFTASAAGVITNEKGQVLLLDHVLRPHSGWGVAGGFLESGEQPEEALRREVREETGLEITNIRLIRIRTLYRHLEIAFRAEAVGTPSVGSPEITDLGWFDPDEMPPEMSPSLRAFILSVVRGELD
jgi:ADP-ribose pyrophosphatase YjhB (NUDIX family)